MMDHAFGGLGLHRVGLTVFSFNDRAIRSYRSVGLVVEGRAREAIWREGRWWDEISMSLLDSDWKEIRRRAVADGTDAAPADEVQEADHEGRAGRATGVVAGLFGRRR